MYYHHKRCIEEEYIEKNVFETYISVFLILGIYSYRDVSLPACAMQALLK